MAASGAREPLAPKPRPRSEFESDTAYNEYMDRHLMANRAILDALLMDLDNSLREGTEVWRDVWRHQGGTRPSMPHRVRPRQCRERRGQSAVSLPEFAPVPAG